MTSISRRALLGGTVALGTFSIAGLPDAAAPRADRGSVNLVVRNAYVMTMEPGVGDLKDADVHVRDGMIVAVGQKLTAPDAMTIDGRDMIVLPGLVGVDWCTWNLKAIQDRDNSDAKRRPSARRVLALATIEGARAMGLADTVGSLRPGKRADLILINTRALNLGVFGDPAVMLVAAVQPANVDTVMVEGRVLKGGMLATRVTT
jgi:cytosine/adenosine deaminase-related metal-dependent hydrolase